MESESYVFPEMWDLLSFRNMGMDMKEERDIIICDTTTDQCTTIRYDWNIDALSSSNVTRNNYLHTHST